MPCSRLQTIALSAAAVLAAALTAPGGSALALRGSGHYRLPAHHRIHGRLPIWRFQPQNAPINLENPGVGPLPPLEPSLPPEPSPGGPMPSLAMPPLTEGMTITVDKELSDKKSSGKPEADSRSDSPPIALPKQAAERLASCWSPPLPQPGRTVEITLRFGFNSSGSVLWPPRITYVKAEQGVSAEDLRASILEAVKACTPLRFTAVMAKNIPGEPISVHFIGWRDDATGKAH